MGKGSGIEWTDHTFNPWWGCTKVSPGCKNCYAETLSARFGGDFWGTGNARRTFGQKHWLEQFNWDHTAQVMGTRARVFSGSMCDVFEHEAPKGERERLFQTIGATPFLDWLLLTKRPERILHEIPAAWLVNPPNNVWYGTSVEDRERKARIDVLRAVPAAVRFLSIEPLLEDLGRLELTRISWVIVGGESGPRRRPMQEDWVRSIRDQCLAAGVAFFYKQRVEESGRKVSLPTIDGRGWAEVPRP